MSFSDIDKNSNVGRHLHELINSLDVLLAALDRSLTYLGPISNDRISLNIGSVLSRLSHDLQSQLFYFIGDLEKKIQADLATGPDSANIILNLKKACSDLSEFAQTSSNFSPVVVQENLLTLGNIVDELKATPNLKYNRERMKGLSATIKEVEHAVTVFHLSNSIDATRTIRNKIINFDKRVNSGAILETSFNAVGVIKECMDKIKSRADFFHVDLKFLDQTHEARLKVDLDSFQHCISNLLDNAVKYTGALRSNSQHKSTWIVVKTSIVFERRKYFRAEIESWGTAVTREEYAEQLMFAEGYRGFFARKLAVSGSGTGLADVRKFTVLHGGRVKYVTTPVDKGSDLFRAVKTTLLVDLPVDA